MSLEGWKEEFEGKNIAIWGYGREGKSTYALIRKVLPSQTLTILESRNGSSSLEFAKRNTVNTLCLFEDEVDMNQFDMIIKSPGIVVHDVNPNLITGEAELFLKHYRNQTVGITGTKGKSTTTSLMHAVLSEKGKCHLVGNIGIPCFDVIEELDENDTVAFEISCHQLEYGHYSPKYAIFLNLFEEHLDHYGSFEKYGDAKANIFRHQLNGDVCIISMDLERYIQEIPHPILIGKDITIRDKTLNIIGKQIAVNQCALVGQHNYLNLAVVYQIAQYFNISDQQFLDAVRKFTPLHHRLEDLGECEDIRYVNDSISTIGQSCIKAIEALDHVDTVLVGGMDRGIEYEELEMYFSEHPDLYVILMYATGKRIYQEMKEKGQLHSRVILVDDLKQAIEQARIYTRKHHICLLSPAASSYDHFKNFEERGREFERLAFQR